MVVKECPEDCTFDWDKFHSDLDLAMAHMIDEAELDTPGEDYLPSKVPVIKLAEYANEKRKLKKEKK